MLELLFKSPMGFGLSPDASVNALQQRLLKDIGLTTEYTIGPDIVSDRKLSDLLKIARIACIDRMEAYFSGDLQPTGCISERNEGAAISLILQRGGLYKGQQASNTLLPAGFRCPATHAMPWVGQTQQALL